VLEQRSESDRPDQIRNTSPHLAFALRCKDMPLETVGFLGLGIMGYPMAAHLVKGGKKVTVWSNNSEKVQQFAKETGAAAAKTPKAVAEAVDVLFLCVGTTEMSREVLLGKDGVVHSGKKGLIVADASTISPESSREIGKGLEAAGIRYLDAPCTGSKAGADGGTLTFMIGGDKALFEQTKPIFDLMGKQFYYCGAAGMGLQAKLTQNLMLANIMQAFNEGMVLATKGGVDPKTMYEILDNSAAKSGLVSVKAPKIFKRDFSTHFSTKWMHKDVSMALDSARSLGVPLPVTAVTQQMFQAAIAGGDADADFCSTIKTMEKLADVEVKG
jgi:3-hydroxyisobutyrate dehydrogenase/2-hydroxy-3-oxopropionate reductase